MPLGVPSGQSRSSAAPSPTTLGLGTQSGGRAAPSSTGVTNLRLVPGFLALRLANPRQSQRVCGSSNLVGGGVSCAGPPPITSEEVIAMITSAKFLYLSCKAFTQENELFTKV